MVVTLLEVGETADGLLFMVMEYLEGDTLARLQAKQNQSWDPEAPPVPNPKPFLPG